MWKIIKQAVEKIVLNKQSFDLTMKWEFKIEFANDSFWPYDYKFGREDCYFNDGLEDRWTSVFPLKNISFDNTEIFLETDDIIIAIWERWSLMWDDKKFIDIINIQTEKKYRLFTDEVNLIYNSEDKVIINAKTEWLFKTIVLDINNLEKLEEKIEEFQAFFKCVYNKATNEWFVLDFSSSEISDDMYKKWSFTLQKSNILTWIPKDFNRKEFKVITSLRNIDIWEESII